MPDLALLSLIAGLGMAGAGILAARRVAGLRGRTRWLENELAGARYFAEQRMLASRDPLTGLLNDREFHETLERELQRARRHGGQAAVALFDLGGIEAVDDGDHVVCAIVDAMEGSCRASDVPFRVGGDAFALLLPETGRIEAATVANRVRRALDDVDARVSVSIGMASWPDDGGSTDVLLAHAAASLEAMTSVARDRRTTRPAPGAGDR